MLIPFHNLVRDEAFYFVVFAPWTFFPFYLAVGNAQYIIIIKLFFQLIGMGTNKDLKS